MDTNIRLDEELLRLVQSLDIKAKPIERYAGYVLLEIFREVLGRNTNFSTNELNVLRRRTTKTLEKYAPWITIDCYPHKEGLSFYTNFNLVFKTNKGTLYGHPEGPLRPLFYTAHALERFVKRTDASQYKVITSIYLQKYSRLPTPHEILDEIILSNLNNIEFGITVDTDIYLNTQIGVLVLESRKDTYVAKTFIDTNYAQRLANWYKIKPVEGYFVNYNIKDLLNGPNIVPCIPTFINFLK